MQFFPSLRVFSLVYTNILMLSIWRFISGAVSLELAWNLTIYIRCFCFCSMSLPYCGRNRYIYINGLMVNIHVEWVEFLRHMRYAINGRNAFGYIFTTHRYKLHSVASYQDRLTFTFIFMLLYFSSCWLSNPIKHRKKKHEKKPQRKREETSGCSRLNIHCGYLYIHTYAWHATSLWIKKIKTNTLSDKHLQIYFVNYVCFSFYFLF